MAISGDGNVNVLFSRIPPHWVSICIVSDLCTVQRDGSHDALWEAKNNGILLNTECRMPDGPRTQGAWEGRLKVLGRSGLHPSQSETEQSKNKKQGKVAVMGTSATVVLF